MNVLILAAGYATRLYPLTENRAKPLLEVAGKPMMEWVVDALAPVPDIDCLYVVTNHKFARDFQAWAEDYQRRAPGLSFRVIDDGSTSPDNMLGAIGDIALAIREAALKDDDLLVVAGDNLFSAPLDEFVQYARRFPAAVGTYDVGTLEQARKYNTIRTDGEGCLQYFEEKPLEPNGTISAIALYYFSRPVVAQFSTYLAEGNNPDQPGRFIQWLHQRLPVFTYPIRGTWFDVGSKESLERADELFRKFAPAEV
jgi:glucose-1-phosphate thymidylyltransferase